jgi:hypothetical protein
MKKTANQFIYRVEHSNGKGPYNDGKKATALKFGHGGENHPCARWDFELNGEWGGWNRDYFCAFQNKKTMMKWFNLDEIKELLKNEYKIFRIKIPRDKVVESISGKQCAFKPEDIIYRQNVTKQFTNINN